MEEVQIFYYKQDDNNGIVLEVHHDIKLVRKVSDVPFSVCEYNQFTFLKKESADVLIIGLHKSMYYIEFASYSNREQNNDEKNLMKFFTKINEKLANPKYREYIKKEYELMDKLNKSIMNYYAIQDKYFDELKKVDPSYIKGILERYGISDDTPIKVREDMIMKLYADKENNDFKKAFEKLKQDKQYQKSNEIQKQEGIAFREYFKNFIEMENHFKKEYDILYSDKYKQRQDEFAERGLFLYCLNTPDLPLEDDKLTIDDFYNYFLFESCLFLRDIIHPYIEHKNFNMIYDREANDLEASFHLLLEKKYWASLRNLYALIEHHHKLCATAFNGFYKKKKELKNGAERSKYINILFEGIRITNYEKAWKKLDSAIKDLNCTNMIYVSRNGIVHGDYENKSINPTAKDVINIMLIYVNLRMITDYMMNLEEIIRTGRVYLFGAILNVEKAKD